MSTMQSPLSQALFSRSQAATLGLLYARPDESFYFRQVVNATGLAVGQIQRELARLADAGIIERYREGQHVYFRAAKDCPIFDEMRSIVTKVIGPAAMLRAAMAPLE